LGYGQAKDIFEKVDKAYDIRSALVHAGKTNDLTPDIFFELTDIVRVSMIHYTKNPNDFSQEALKNVVF
jgi:hypothetical protein